ncbi:MAG: hypothetical protein JNN18_08800 [Rubrivivax sp.]|nr:hypothetical protein [Rubrivivax sp.]
MDESGSDAGGFNASQVRAELARLLASSDFAGARAHQRLLVHLVERTLEGDTAALKESMVAIDVFNRPAQRFDPAADSIVRVEARRLRQRLEQHYRDAGRDAALRIELPKGAYQPRFVPVRLSTDDPRTRAQELAQRGHYFLRVGHETGHRKALSRYQAAVAVDPTLADAHVGIARAWLKLVNTNIEPPLPGIDHALDSAHAALKLQPGQADALALCAQLEQRFRYDWPTAEALFQRAIEAAPVSPEVRHAHAFALMLRRAYAEAEAELVVARRLDPLNLGLRAHEALLHLYRREWDLAQETLEALLDLSPDNVLGLALAANVHWLRGDAEAALAGYRAVAQQHPNLSIGAAGCAMVQAATGRHTDADETLAALRARFQGRYLPPYQLAMVEAARGRRDEAISLLTRAIDERDPNAVCLPVDPCFDPIATDDRLQALVQRVLGIR